MTSAQIQQLSPAIAAPVPTAVPSSEKPHHVHTTLSFLRELEDGSHLAPNYAGDIKSYLDRPLDVVPVTVHDVSGHELDYALDTHGFQFYYHISKEKTFLDDDRIKRDYYPETEKLLKDATGASRVFIFDHTIRRPPSMTGSEDGIRTPVQRVHVDQTPAAAKDRVEYHLPEDAPELLKGRYQIINVWRPIKTIKKDPLAVADALSVPDTDLIPMKLIYPDRVGETYSVKESPAAKWYYRYGQTPDLVTLIKCFDSKTDGRPRRAPHSAFVNPETEREDPRESIEVRAIVFHPEDRN